VNSGNVSSSTTIPVKASNSPSTLGTGNPHPFFCPDGWPNAPSRAGVSGAIVLDPSTRNARSPRHSAASPAAAAEASRRAADEDRSSDCTAATGSRLRASQ
jgi:hypothetical protein